MHNELKQKGLPPRRGLARKLLSRAASIVANSPLYGLIVYAVGCIVPLPLDPEPPPTNYRPVIIHELVDPPLNMDIKLAVNDRRELTVVAEDPNAGDDLYARLFAEEAG